MMKKCSRPVFFCVVLGITGAFSLAQIKSAETIDQKVNAVLQRMSYQWRDMNVPEEDGKLLYKIVIKNNYKRALELGTSTGHSGIWIAWALSKTGGKLITVEIDERRHREAVEHFKEAGLSEFVDARLADAHDLVNELSGPFDFVFIDADKDWYTNYAQALIPKLEAGGCMTAHNIYEPRPGRGRRYGRGGTGEYYEFMKGQPDFETSVLPESRGGLSVSYKKNQ